MKALAKFKPWWIEEPTSPDDILGHAAIAKALKPLEIGVATGEVCANKVMFKQLLQSEAISFCQIDSCRVVRLWSIFRCGRVDALTKMIIFALYSTHNTGRDTRDHSDSAHGVSFWWLMEGGSLSPAKTYTTGAGRSSTCLCVRTPGGWGSASMCGQSLYFPLSLSLILQAALHSYSYVFHF